MKRSNPVLRRVAAVALLALLGACVAGGTHTTESRTVRSTDRGDVPKLTYVETQRLVTVVFTAEGPKDSVLDFDIDYQLEGRDGQRTPLPFLGAHDASPLDVLNRVFHDAGRDTWIGLSVRSSNHSEHVQKLEWQYVEDDFTKIRVVEFTRDHLVRRHDLRVCNPVRRANPVILIDPASHTLRYCTQQGTATYDSVTGQERLLSPDACCPSSSSGSATRSENDFLVEGPL